MGCCDDSTDAYTNILSAREYEVAFNGGTPTQATFVLWNGAGHNLRVTIPYPVTPMVSKYGCDLASTHPGDAWCRGKKTSLTALDSATRSAYYYDAVADTLYLKIVDRSTTGKSWRSNPSPEFGTGRKNAARCVGPELRPQPDTSSRVAVS